jgi:polyhydroxyalkanoate synthase subunit PhaC
MAKSSKSKTANAAPSGGVGKSSKAGRVKPKAAVGKSASAKIGKTSKAAKAPVSRAPVSRPPVSRAKARKADAKLVERFDAHGAAPEMKFQQGPQAAPAQAAPKSAPQPEKSAGTGQSSESPLLAALSGLAGLAGLGQQSGQLGAQLGAQLGTPFGGAMPGLEKFTVRDPEEMARNMVGMLETGGKAIADYIGKGKMDTNPMGQAAEAGETAKTLGEIYQNWMKDPQKFAQSQQELLQGFMQLWNGTITKAAGGQTKPVAEPAPGDNRFKDPDWSSNAYFDFWKQAYLLTAQWSEKMLAGTEGLDEPTRRKADFLFRQIAAAFAPSNFPFTNPEVVRETLASSGQNLLKGMQNLASDMERSDKLLSISQTDTSAFEVGRNIAVTPGKVIYQNELIQLIQYTPTTKNVIAEPLLIVPPWINKFYILDLTQEKSFIKYAVDNGISVFVLSWVNPDEKLGHKTFEDYMKQGILMATDAVARESGGHKPHVIGYCVGGTLLATTMAWLAAKGVDGYTSATFFAAQQDFTKGGDLKLFIDDEQLAKLDTIMAEKGYLEGARMATVFNMLRPKDLIWPYIVNNYMLGKKPFPFDLLYWNQDSTRMSPANHSYYLREFYQHNKLAKGELEFAGEKLDLGKVTTPVYTLAAKEDHIAPAESVFISGQLFGGPVRYVLGGSGHIAGVINPPYKPKYQYWTSDSMAKTYQGWLKGAKETPGSWWPDWVRWIKEHSSGEVAARVPGARLGVIEDAPGSYVKVKS